MKLPSLEAVKLLKPRLGFGAAETCDDADIESAVVPQPDDPPKSPETHEVSLLNLADQLALEVNLPPAAVIEPPKPEPLIEAAGADPSTPDPAPDPEQPPEQPPIPQAPPAPLEGCRVGAIGFGRQDIAGLAAAMLENRARVEFLPREDEGRYSGFDLLLLNCASLDLLKRDMSSVQSILASGIPAIVIGTRASLTVLRGIGDSQAWDFASKPLHMGELIWRASNLLSRCREGDSRKLPPHVVVADHDPFTRTLIESALSRQGFDCELTEDGEAAWAAIENSRPGAVILDLTLPNRDGFQLMADIRRTPGRKPKVIVLSARQSEADILRAFALGADDYLTKPFSPLELSARLTRLIGSAPENE